VKLIVLKNNIPLNEISVDTTDPLENYEIFVGRSKDCHVLIDDPVISRHHFVLKRVNSKWFCEKLSHLGSLSINGTLINNQQINSNDELRFGIYSLYVSEIEHRVDNDSLTSNDNKTVIIEEKSNTNSEAQIQEPDVVDSALIVEDQGISQENELNKPNDFLESSPLNELPSEDFEGHLNEINTSFDNELSSDSHLESSQDSSNDQFPISTDAETFDEGTRFFKTFINYELHISGEFAPYDRFQIDQDEIFIGRDTEKCQIKLNDPDVSSLHAVLRKNYNEIYLEDLGSSNGTILNGERVNKARINTGDEFLIGSTSFSLEVRSDLLDNEADRLMPVESGQVIETEELIEEEVTENNAVNLNDDIQEEKSLIKRVWKDPVKRKKAIYILTFGALVMLLLPEEEKEIKTDSKISKAAPKKPEIQSTQNLKLSKEIESARNIAYELGVSYFDQSRYDMAQIEFQKVVTIDPNYKKVQSYLEQTNVGLKKLAELEAQKRAEEERIKIKKIIDELLVKAREAVEKREVQTAENIFSQIIEKDPENFELAQIKMELEAWQKDQEKKALELAAKEAERKKMIDALNPGKTFYLKKEWHAAIFKLENFLKLKGIHEDLLKEASEMLTDAKNQMELELTPILSKARTLKEDQDLKASYEAFLDVLKLDPTHAEALNEADNIKTQLDVRSKKIYREAIIAESLSLFTDAREKFQEVQQVSPTDSEYYKKASEKLKNYLE